MLLRVKSDGAIFLAYPPFERILKLTPAVTGTPNNSLIDNMFSYQYDPNRIALISVGGNTSTRPAYFTKNEILSPAPKSCLSIDFAEIKPSSVLKLTETGVSELAFTEETDNHISLSKTHQVATISLSSAQYSADLAGQNPERNPCGVSIEKDFTDNEWTMVHPTQGRPINLVAADSANGKTGTCKNGDVPNGAGLFDFEFKIKSVMKGATDVTAS